MKLTVIQKWKKSSERPFLKQAETEGKKQIRPAIEKVKEKRNLVVLDFIGRPSYKIERILKRAGYHVSYRKGRNLENLTRKKERKDSENLSSKGVVYEIVCSGCGLSYIGETGQPLGVRIEQHKRAVKHGDMNNAFYTHHFSKTLQNGTKYKFWKWK